MIKNKLAQLNKYFGLFIIFGIFILFIFGADTSGEVIDNNCLDTSEGQSYGRLVDHFPSEGVMKISLGDIPRNLYEDGCMKRIEDVKTLEDKGFAWVYLVDDPDYEMEMEFSNFSYLKKFKLKSNVEGNIPFKMDNIPIFNTEFLEGEEIEFENVYVGNIFAHNYSFGEHSDVIKLQNNVTENMEDMWVENGTTGWNWGQNQGVQFGEAGPSGGSEFRAYFKFGNITDIPANQRLLNTTFWGWVHTVIDTNCPQDFGIYRVYNQTWNEGPEIGGAGTPNWDDQMCGRTFLDSSQCNLTAQDTLNCAGIADDAWFRFNVTESVGIDYRAGNANTSFVIKLSSIGAVRAQRVMYSAEYGGDLTKRPFLLIYYEALPDTTAPYFTSHSNNQTAPINGEDINLSINVNDNLDIDFVFFSTNDSGSWTNYSFQPTATTLHFNYTVLTVASTRDSTVGYAWYANDSLSNVNRTLNQSDNSYYFFRVAESPPVVNSVAINPAATYIDSTLDCGANITNDNGWAYTNFTWFFQDDGAGAWNLNATESLINTTSNAYGNTTIDINSTWLNKDDVWLCQAISYDITGSSILNSSPVTILETAPTITIIYPVAATNYEDNVTALDYVYTSVNPDICFYSLNNEINTSISCGTNVTGITSISGTNLWKIWINSTYGTLDSSSVTFGIINWTENSQTFNDEAHETDSETFILNVTLRVGSGLSAASLIYNETIYSVSDIEVSGTHSILTRSIDLPLNLDPFNNLTNSFYWNFTYSFGGSQTVQNSSMQQQNVSFINFQLCNGTYSTGGVNFTFMDELTGIEINATENATDIEATFRYWLGSGTIYKNYSYINLSSSFSQFHFCIYPVNKTLQIDMDMDYEAVDYAPRTYFFNAAPLDNVTNDIDLNLMFLSDATKFFFEVRKGMLVFPDATVTISKYDTGEDIWETIGIRETDIDGEFIEYMELDKTYRFSFVKEGISYGYVDKVASCAESPCEIILQIEEAITHLWQGYYDVFATRIAYTLDYNDTDNMVTYSFNDLTGLAQNFRLRVTEIAYNQSSSTICNEIAYAIIGELTCNMTGYEGDFTATGYVSRSPEKIVDTLNFIISTIKDTLGVTGVLVSLFIIITIGLIGVWNPTVGVILVCFAVFMMKLLGFVAFGYTTVILVFILGGILAYQMKK